MKPLNILITAAILLAIASVLYISLDSSAASFLFNPGTGQMALGTILLITFILGILHGVTPDEHTWPITFSYAIGSYSTRKGMKAGFAFSTGFTIQRAILTTLGFLGLAVIYQKFNLDGPVYMIVGIVMAISGMYILNKRKYIHLPFDVLLKGKRHHTELSSRVPMHESDPKPVPIKLAVVHGFIAGWGFGAYSTIIVFILAPKVPGLIYAPLPGLFFGLGTMVMQIVLGALFANFARSSSLSESQMKFVGRKTAGRTLYYGGVAFALIGALILAFPVIDKLAVSTGNPIPNLDSIGVATVLVLIVVGVIGAGNIILLIREVRGKRKSRRKPKS
jgi:ABC-type nickel/cobalt efflux system permease component RcnA